MKTIWLGLVLILALSLIVINPVSAHEVTCMSLSDYQKLISDNVRDDENIIDTNHIDTSISLALNRYSKDRPNVTVEDVVADGTHILPKPTGWQNKFSKISTLEYPIGEVPPSTIETAFWQMYQAPTGEQIQTHEKIGVGESVRVNFSTKHTIDIATTTVPECDKIALASFAAALLCDELAAHYSGDSDSTIQADNVDHGDKATRFSRRAGTLRKRYFNELGINPKKNNGHAVIVSLDKNLHGGGKRITHQ